MCKSLKNNKGFTLVEVIVVAVIVLILAAVAIPLYNGYIEDARKSSVENVAGSIAGAMGAGYQMLNTDPTITPSGASIGGADAIALVIAGNNIATNTIMIPKGMGFNVGGGFVTVTHERGVTASIQYRATN